MQSAYDFALLVESECDRGDYFDSSGNYDGSGFETCKAEALIRARDKEIVELCREAAKEATLWKEHPCIDAEIDKVLRDLG